MNKTKLLLLIIILVLIALIVVVLVITSTEKGGNPSLRNIKIAEEIYGFSAIIKEINGNTLTVEGSIPRLDSTREPVKATIDVTVNGNTKIVKLKFPANGEEGAVPKETTIQPEDLKTGDEIAVSSAMNISSKIKSDEKFSLINIFVVEK
jgi:hypothetical protein